MEFLQSVYLTQMMHTISEAMTVPVVVILLVLIVYSVYTIGSLVVEAAVERRSYSVRVPELVARIETCEPAELGDVIDKSGLLRAQADDLHELADYLYLPEDGRTEVAKRLLANEEGAHRRMVDHVDVSAKVAPMLGLMGTLIPLGPGIEALGRGEPASAHPPFSTNFQKAAFPISETAAMSAHHATCLPYRSNSANRDGRRTPIALRP